MGKSSPSTPQAPNYEELMRQSAMMNRINVTSPFGSSVYSGDDLNNLTVTPTNQIQNIIGLGQNTGQTLAQYGNMMTGFLPNSPLSAEGLPEYMTGINVGGLPQIGNGSAGYRQALYDQQIDLMRPEWDRQQEALNQDLSNRGMPLGGEAYNNVMGEFTRNKNAALQQAANIATTGAAGLDMSARSQLFNEGLGQVGLNNAGREAMLGERATLRNAPLADIQNYLNLAGTQAQLPASSDPGSVDVMGAASNDYASGMAAYNAAQSRNGGIWNGLIGLGTGLVGLIP